MDRHLTAPAVTRAVLVAAAATGWLAAWAVFAGTTLLMPHRHEPSAPAFLAATTMWLTMVVAMMMPTVLPWITAYAELVTPPGNGPSWRAIGAFTAGYLVVWALYALAAAALQMALMRIGLLAGDRIGPALGGVVLLAAGAFQFAPLKGACLAHCRNPLSYFLARWHNGPIGGLRLGLSHGAYCLGCCWLVMLTALAMGVMNLTWMAVLTAVVALEQLAPAGVRLGRGFGVALLTWGAWLLAAA